MHEIDFACMKCMRIVPYFYRSVKRVIIKQKSCRLRHRPYACDVVSERFHNSENENGIACKNHHGKKFSVFVLRRSLCWFVSFNYALKCMRNLFKYFVMKMLENGTVCT